MYGVFQKAESVVQLHTVLRSSAACLSCSTEAVVMSSGVSQPPACLLIRGTAASDFTEAAVLQVDKQSHSVP